MLPNGMRIGREIAQAIDRQVAEYAEFAKARTILAMDEDWLKRMVASELTEISAFFFLFDEKPVLKHEIMGDGVGVIKIRGPLARKSNYRMTYDDILQTIQTAVADQKVKSVLLDIDSPGGVAAGMYEASEEIAKLRGQKPIWSYANDLMASAAYGIGAAADRALGSSYSQVGSIGVVMMHLEFSKMNEKMGVKPTFIFAGRKKVWGNAEEPLDPGAKKEFQDIVDAHYDRFVETVNSVRPSLSEKAIRKTEAGVLTGEQAKVAGLIDDVMSFDDALAALSDVTKGKGGKMTDPKANSEVTDAGATAAAAGAGSTPAPSATVIDLDKEREKARAEGRKEAAEQNREITELCTMAGQLGLAAKFITEGKTVAEVRTELLKLRASASGEDDVVGSHGRGLPGAGKSLAGAMKSMLKGRGMEPRPDSLSAFPYTASGEGK